MDILRKKQFIWNNIADSLSKFFAPLFATIGYISYCLRDVPLMATLCCFFMPRVFCFRQLSYPAVSLTVFGICVQLLSKTSVSSSGSAFSLELKGRVLTRNLGDASLQFSPVTQILLHASYCLSSLSFYHLWGYKCYSHSACDRAWWFLYS